MRCLLPHKSLYREARVAMSYPADWWCMCSMQYEYEKTIIEFCGGRIPGRPSRSRRQGADTVPHVLLRWHGSCLGKLRYPQKARQLNFAWRSRSHGPLFFFSTIVYSLFSLVHYICIYIPPSFIFSCLSPLFFVWHDTHDNHRATRDKSYDHEICAIQLNHFNCPLEIIIIRVFLFE